MNKVFKQKSQSCKAINNQNQVFVFGHRNPDTDAIVSALVYAAFLRRMKINAKAYRLGNLNKETQFVLKTAGIQPPNMLPSDLANGTAVALVDHNESQQSMENLKNMRVKYVVDHHKLGDLTTSEPIYIRFEPVGCTATILTKMYRENQLRISQKIALLLIPAILSDTLHFRSSTTTDDDRSMVDYLLPIAKITDVNSYANEMLIAKSNLSNYTMREVLLDYKTYTFNNQLWGIGVAETFYPNNILERKDELLQAMIDEKKTHHLTDILFSIIDIVKERNSMIILSEPEKTVVEKAFNVTIQNGIADLGSRISRKKDIVPALELYFKTNT
ncbi:unnamed protein product [Rotaria sordida]|uniref:inorganic diphosphatase n=1 Tax=Rotaria sordida TaxID=392033 RepID=A0A820AGZ6_9BILA|nr:unnamed protein product [Rotaria sordida]CAF1482182.1 unnamed protein product [Rotaria sordida]CAF1627956.1 unnamed protein product [Rotaria sordida]CAF4185377.1 unnamed protein product [Rotaria sordida]